MSISTEAFLPHGDSFYWRIDVLLPMVVGDGLIALGYLLFSFLLFYVIAHPPTRMQWLRGPFFVLGLFALSCSFVHILDVWNIWNDDYHLSSIMTLIAGSVGLTSAFLWLTIVPRLLHVLGVGPYQSTRLDDIPVPDCTECVGKLKDRVGGPNA